MLVRRFLAFTAVAAAGAVMSLAVMAPRTAFGDSPTNGQLLVPGDHHLPGATIEITGYELDPGITLEVRLVSASLAASLGKASVLPDGTFTMSAVIPATFPPGYAQILATNSGAGDWATTILVGERAEGPGASGVRIDGEGPFVDVAFIGFLMVAIGLIVAVGAAVRYLRGRPKGPSTSS